MRIGVIIPDRNDRPEFLKNCMRMLERQTRKPDVIELVNDPPKDEHCDITYRYRTGYERMSGQNIDLIAFIENDDWYSSKYLEVHSEKWLEVGRPVIFGTNYTIYYHLKLKKYFTMYHEQRSSAMNTFLRPNQTINWGEDVNPYTDLQLWEKMRGLVWQPPLLSLGIKHGIGKTGGAFHVDYIERYSEQISQADFLEKNILPDDPEGYEFYKNFPI